MGHGLELVKKILVVTAENGDTPLLGRNDLQRRGLRNIMMQLLRGYTKLVFPLFVLPMVDGLLHKLNCPIIWMHYFVKVNWTKRWRRQKSGDGMWKKLPGLVDHLLLMLQYRIQM